ncbi:hypothetical protein F2P81_024449 [Scophthalmus maximus]|uniref:Uncharacterized protein n=1 Tax=Scophthalmus maximus TaxID=52904 RepID=A0A6A4RU14_SCOMX|nr:hypothetical protein F2P81_024449 [Scophthalmus maximus]
MKSRYTRPGPPQRVFDQMDIVGVSTPRVSLHPPPACSFTQSPLSSRSRPRILSWIWAAPPCSIRQQHPAAADDEADRRSSSIQRQLMMRQTGAAAAAGRHSGGARSAHAWGVTWL